MYWRFRRLHYDILIPKLDKDISKLNPIEAKEYFDWFMSKIPERIAYLSKVCAKEMGVSEDRLDYSPESLVLLWKWFRKRAKTESLRLTEEQKKISFMCLPKRKLTLETEYILRDIGMYFGETFVRNDPDIYWCFYTHPHRDIFVNRPLLMGFIDRTTGKPWPACLEPIHFARVQGVKIAVHESSDTDLLNVYNIWNAKK